MRPFGFQFMSALLIGTLLNPLNSAMIATALVPIGRDLQVGPSSTAWLIASLYLAAGIGQPFMGRIAELYGPWKVNVAGLVLVAIAGLGGALAPGLGWLIAVRALLGLGTSASYPAAITMLRARAEETGAGVPGTVLGLISITSQASAVVGPALGGLLVGLTGWRSIFLVNVPLAVGGLVLGWLWLPRDRPRGVSPGRAGAGIGREIDVVGIVLFGAAMTTLLLFLMRLRPHPPYALLAAAVAFFCALAWWELRRDNPFLDVRMLAHDRGLTLTYVRYALHWLIIYCVLFGLSQWLEEGRGLSPEATGLVTLPMAGVAVIAAAVVSPRVRVRGPMLLGTAAMIAGTFAMIALHGASPIVLLVLVTAVLGLPQGLGSVTNQAALYRQAPEDRMGSASGLLRTSQYFGAILQSSLIGVVFGARADDAALHDLAPILGGLSVVLLLITAADRNLRR
jgi:MFS family permease